MGASQSTSQGHLAQASPHNQPHSNNQRYSDQSSRIVVDIRGANLDDDYQVYIKRHQEPRVESNVRTVTNTIQSVGGVLVTLFTLQKLFEEIRFIRALRGELASIASSFMDGDGRQPSPEMKSHGTADMSLSQAASTTSNNQQKGTTWDKIAGLVEVKMLLQEATVLPILRPDMFTGIRQPPRGILLFGPPGSGKTMLAKAVASESRATFLAVTGSNILSMWYGQSEQNVKALFEKARAQQPAVIFIDEVDSLLGKRSGQSQDSMPDKRVTNEFLAFIDGIQTEQEDKRIIIMAATNNPWDLDEAALSRFARRIYVPLPDRRSRADLICKAMAGVATAISDAHYLELADKCSKYSGRDLVHICREASMRPLRELWGNKLLEGGGGEEHLAQQRLVSTVAGYIRKGKHIKRIRKELADWKRKQKGSADWCNVEDVIAQAQRSAGSSGADTGGAAAASASPAAAASNRQGSASGSSTSHEAMAASGAPASGPQHKHTRSSEVEQQVKRGRWGRRKDVASRQSSTGGCMVAAGALDAVGSSGLGTAAALPAMLYCDGEPDAPGTRVIGHADSEPCCVATAVADNGPCCLPAPAQQGSGELSLALASAHSGDEQCRTAGTGGNTRSVADSSCNLTSTSSAETSSTSTSSTTSAAHGASTPAAAPSPPQPNTSSSTSSNEQKPRQGRGSKAKPNTSAGDGASEPGTWTVDELLALPADTVRPVTVEDFDFALKQIMPSDFDLTNRYEEWNGRFGSGTDIKQGSSLPTYAHMYM